MNEERIFEMLSELKTRADVTNERLDWYNRSLDFHIKRSDMLEEQVDELYKLKYYAMGAMAVITGLLTIFFDIIKTYITGGN
jgi:hypothetical protein